MLSLTRVTKCIHPSVTCLVTRLLLQRLSSCPPPVTCWAPSVTPALPRRPRYRAQVTRWGLIFIVMFMKVSTKSNLMKVELRFTSDESSADTGFLVTWAEKPGCGRLLTEASICLIFWFLVWSNQILDDNSRIEKVLFYNIMQQIQ